MKQLPFFIAFLISSPTALPQSNSSQESHTAPSLPPDQWDLNKYLWSHTHPVSSKPGKRVMNFDDIENHISLSEDPADLSISPNGQYFAYGIQNTFYRRRDTLVVQSTKDLTWRKAFTGANPGFFSVDSKQYVFQKQDSLCFLQTANWQLRYIGDVVSYQQPPGGKGEWIAYQLKSNELVLHNLRNGSEKRYPGISTFQFDDSGNWLSFQLNNEAKELVIHHLSSGKQHRFPSVADYAFHSGGKALAFKTAEKSNNNLLTRLCYVGLPQGKSTTIWSSMDSSIRIPSYSLDGTGRQVVFLVQEPASAAEPDQPQNSIWYYHAAMDKAVVKVNQSTQGMEAGWAIQSAIFTENNRYILFTLAPPKEILPEPIPGAVKMDLWSYKDTVLQSTQPYLLKMPKAYNAVISTDGHRVIRLEQERETWKGYKITGDYVVISKTGQEIHGDRFWEKGFDEDTNWLLSLKDGSRRLLATKTKEQLWFSPGGKYLVYYDNDQKGNYFSIDLSNGALSNISSSIPDWQLAICDHYQRPPEKDKLAVGIAGWLEGDSDLLVFDNYDIWQLDLAGKKRPINITNGYGRNNQTTFALTGYGLGNQLLSGLMQIPIFPERTPLLLRAFNLKNKISSIYLKILNEIGDPVQLFMAPFTLSNLPISTMDIKFTYDHDKKANKAAKTNLWIVKRESSVFAPNYFKTSDFKIYSPLTNIQPQIKYHWLTAELHSFKQLDGSFSQGILYKPENFDSTKKYPVIVSFYTVLSDRVHKFPSPTYLNTPNSLKENPGWLTSHDYIVFTPDIYFTKGQWGPSALNTVEGAANYLQTLPFVDKTRIGAVGHSNSGRFGAYILTHSNSFAAIALGEGYGFANVISASLTLFNEEFRRSGSTLENFEKSSMGGGLGNLWNNKKTWLDHSAVLHADKVNSPLFMFCVFKEVTTQGIGHNKIEQAIQLFTSLRRLEKKVWWLAYNEALHTVFLLRDQKDFTLRYTQFFDHYLKGAPAPRWMTCGISYKLKGLENGYELDANGICGKDCTTCHKLTEQKSLKIE